MENGLSGQELPVGFPYKDIIEGLCVPRDFSPCLVGAVKINETGLGQGPTTENDISGDGGHGIMQLTSSWPDTWADPTANIEYAIDHFLMPEYEAWTSEPYNLQGEELVKAIGASYNEGLGTAEEDHTQYGNVDRGTTNDYGARCLAHYLALLEGTIP